MEVWLEMRPGQAAFGLHSECIAQRELLHSGRCKRGVVDSERAIRQVVVKRLGASVEANRVRYVEDLPVEGQLLPFPGRPGFADAGVDAKVSIAAKVVPLSSLARVGKPDGIALPDDAVVDCGDVVEDLWFAIAIEVPVNAYGSGANAVALQMPVCGPARFQESEGQSACPAREP